MENVFKFPVAVPNEGKNVLAEAEGRYLSLMMSWLGKNDSYQSDMNRTSRLKIINLKSVDTLTTYPLLLP